MPNRDGKAWHEHHQTWHASFGVDTLVVWTFLGRECLWQAGLLTRMYHG